MIGNVHGLFALASASLWASAGYFIFAMVHSKYSLLF